MHDDGKIDALIARRKHPKMAEVAAGYDEHRARY
jgi:hypothetical protein